MKKEYTLDNFAFDTILNESTGEWRNKNPYFFGISDEGKYNINYSGILTKLIQVAGKTCTHYASDLFIDWNIIERELGKANYQGGKYLFGFREMGVDGNAFVLSRLNNYGKEQMEKTIIELYMVEVNVNCPDIKFTFGTAKVVEN